MMNAATQPVPSDVESNPFHYHYDELYSIDLYGGPGEGDHTVYTDLIITGAGRFNKMLYLASLYDIEKNINQVSFQIQQSKSGKARHPQATFGNYNRDYPSVSIMSHTKKNRYHEHSSKMGDLTHRLLVSKEVDAKTKDRQDWEMNLSEMDRFRRPPADLSEMIIAWDGDIENQIFEVLKDRYGTPMHEDWKDYIVGEIMDNNHFRHLYVYTFGNYYDVAAGILRLSEFQLEDIITQGIQSFEIEFAILQDDTVEPVLDKCDSVDEYLSHFAGDLAQSIQNNIDIRFDPLRDTHSPAFQDVNLTANEKGLTGLFPPQADTVMATAKTLLEDDYAFAIGEMG